MEQQFICRDCGTEHLEPAEARLGHVVLCLDCSMLREYDARRIAERRIDVVESHPPIAA